MAHEDQRTILLVGYNQRLASEALRALELIGQQAWVVVAHPGGDDLRRSRWETRVLNDQTPLPGRAVGDAIVQAARLVDATHIVSDDVGAFVAVADLGDELCPARRFPSLERAQLEALDNKASFTTMAKAAGLPVVPSVVAQDLASATHHGLDYPIIIKPVDASGGKGLRRCERHSELEAQLARWPTYPQLLQPYVPGEDLHLSAFGDRGEIVAWEMHQPHPLPSIGYRACRFVRDDQVVEIARLFMAATDYHGVANLDFRREPSGALWLLECNPRLYVRSALAAKAGANFMKVGLDLADGRRPRVPAAAREGVIYDPQVLPDLLWRGRLGPLLTTDAPGAVVMALAHPRLAYRLARWRLYGAARVRLSDIGPARHHG